MLGASKSGPFLGGMFLKPLINQLLLKVQLGDSDFLEAEEDLGGVATVQLLKSDMSQQKIGWWAAQPKCIQNWSIRMESGLRQTAKLLAKKK